MKQEKKELSKREKQILILVAEGYKNQEIAEKLFISVRTVHTHRVNITNKLGTRNVVQLIHYAIQKGLFKVEVEATI